MAQQLGSKVASVVFVIGRQVEVAEKKVVLHLN